MRTSSNGSPSGSKEGRNENGGSKGSRLDRLADGRLGDSGDDRAITATRRSALERVAAGQRSTSEVVGPRNSSKSSGSSFSEEARETESEEDERATQRALLLAQRDRDTGGGLRASLKQLFGFVPTPRDHTPSPMRQKTWATSVYDHEDPHRKHLHTHSRGGSKESAPARKLAPGEEAFVANERAIQAMGSNRIGAVAQRGGKVVYPIAKRYDRIKEDIILERARQAEEDAANSKANEPTKSLHEWFSAGLCFKSTDLVDNRQIGDRRAIEEGRPVVQGARPVPEGYEIAMWSSALIPLVRHVVTGTLIWPIRFDLMPLYNYVEGRKEAESFRAMTTVFHYTSSGGFGRFVAPPSDENAENWEFAEELWDRLEDDFERHSLPDVEGAPEFSLPLLSSEPNEFRTRQAVASAMHRAENTGHGPGKCGHCVAFRVPTDHCLAAAAEEDDDFAMMRNTVVVLAPGKDDEDILLEEAHDASKKKKAHRLVQWGQRQVQGVVGKKSNIPVADDVRNMDLLADIIDRETGQILLTASTRRPTRTGNGSGGALVRSSLGQSSVPGNWVSEGSFGGSKETNGSKHMVGREMAGSKERSGSKEATGSKHKGSQAHELHEHDEEEAALKLKIDMLMDEKALLERKIRHAEKHASNAEAGVECDLLAADSTRIAKLQRMLVRKVQNVANAEKELADLLNGDSHSSGSSPRSAKTGTKSGSPRSSPKHQRQSERESGSKARSAGVGSSPREGVGLSAADVISQLSSQFAPTGGSSARERRMRRAKKNRTKLPGTEFAPEAKDEIGEYGEEYEDMEDDMFREVFGGSVPGVRKWLEKGQSVNAYHPSTGWTPLLMAASQGDPRLVDLLAEFSADFSLSSKEFGLYAVHIAVRKNSMDMLRLILERHPSSVSDKAKDASTALLTCVDEGPFKVRDDMVRMLLEASSEPNAARKDFWTPLGIAVARNYRTAIKLLIQHRGSIFDDCPDTNPCVTVWQAAARHPGLQLMIKGKLNSRDIHLIEKRWPGSLHKLDVGRKPKEKEAPVES